MRFLADSHGWIVNATPNPRTVRQMLRVLNQLVSDNFLAQHSLAHFFGWVSIVLIFLCCTNFHTAHFSLVFAGKLVNFVLLKSWQVMSYTVFS